MCGVSSIVPALRVGSGATDAVGTGTCTGPRPGACVATAATPSKTLLKILSKQKWIGPPMPESRAIEALHKLDITSAWYIRCLEDMNRRVPVRALDEAQAGYQKAWVEAQAVLTEARP